MGKVRKNGKGKEERERYGRTGKVRKNGKGDEEWER